MTRAIGYIRVSTTEQGQDGHSLGAQRAKIEAYASLYDLELIEVIEDAGVSAKTLNRPGLQKALEMLSRSTLSYMENLQKVHLEPESTGISLIDLTNLFCD